MAEEPAQDGSMEDGSIEDGPAAAPSPDDRRHDSDSTVDRRWARRQTPLALIGVVISVLALAAATVATVVLPLSAAAAKPLALAAVVGAAVLAASCVVVGACWLIQVRRWRSDPSPLPTGAGGLHGLPLISLIAHLVSYVAVVVTMYGAIAGSARAYWDSLAATLLGGTFLLAIFGQILGGTQVLRNDGPPATIPVYLRRLNAKVQSLR